MSVRRIAPKEAHDLCERESYVYLDVRSVPEYAAGHPAGAYNVPLLHFQGGRMVANPEFLDVVRRHFAPDAKLVVGCKTGGRSNRAANLLAEQGYSDVLDVRGGWVGEADQSGHIVEPGWSACGLPASTSDPGRSYTDLGGK